MYWFISSTFATYYSSRLLVKAVFPPKMEPSLYSLIRLGANR